MNIIEYMKKKYDNREDKGNIFGVGISDAEFRRIIIDYLLGSDWHGFAVIAKAGSLEDQVNEEAMYQILEKYSERFRKELKAGNKDDKDRYKQIYKRNKG